MRIKAWFLYFFREIFVYHHSSLEFRAKLLAALICTNKKITACEEEILEEIAREIYKKDEARVSVLVNTTKEYVYKVIERNGLDIDELIRDIDRDLKEIKRFIQKVDVESLKRFRECSIDDEETYLLQTRVIEYLEGEIRRREQISEK